MSLSPVFRGTEQSEAGIFRLPCLPSKGWGRKGSLGPRQPWESWAGAGSHAGQGCLEAFQLKQRMTRRGAGEGGEEFWIHTLLFCRTHLLRKAERRPFSSTVHSPENAPDWMCWVWPTLQGPCAVRSDWSWPWSPGEGSKDSGKAWPMQHTHAEGWSPLLPSQGPTISSPSTTHCLLSPAPHPQPSCHGTTCNDGLQMPAGNFLGKYGYAWLQYGCSLQGPVSVGPGSRHACTNERII